MNFKYACRVVISGMIGLLLACSDADKEKNLIDLHTTASQDVIAISFPDASEQVISVNAQVDYTLQGLKSNGVDTSEILRDIKWSLSAGATSRVDLNGLLSAGNIAEEITLTAHFGFLSKSIDIKVSSAKFDQVVKLDEEAFDIDMCRSQLIKPIGRYIDENNDEEIRPVDSTIINDIEWIILNQSDNSDSQKAYIETSANQTLLHTLAAGDLIIQARATSLFSGNIVTSVSFAQSVSNRLNQIKLCPGGDQNLQDCSITTASIEKDQVLSIMAVGNYQASDGSDFYQNITRNSLWGLSNSNASSVFSSDRLQFEVTGITEDTTTTVSVACGNVQESLVGIEIAEGVNLGAAVSCGSNADCFESSQLVNVTKLSVNDIQVSANGISLTNDQTVQLNTRPNEIELTVTATLSNNSQPVITSDDELTYSIISIEGDVIEEKTGSLGVFTVLAAGTAKIQLNFRSQIFTVVIEVP